MDDIVTTKHSLFVDETNADIEVEIEGVGDRTATVKLYNAYSLHIGEFASENVEIIQIIRNLQLAEEGDTITVYIDSPGGSVFEGIRLINNIKRYFGDRVTTILDPQGASMASIMFTIGETRIMPEHGHIMFHNYSAAYEGTGKLIGDEIKFFEKQIRSIYIKYMKDFFSESEIDEIANDGTSWIDAEEAALRGLATHIEIDGEVITAEEYLDRMN